MSGRDQAILNMINEAIRIGGVPMRAIGIYIDNLVDIIEGKVEDTGEFIGRV